MAALDRSFTVEDLTESEDGVTVRQHITATHAGEFLGIAPSGRKLDSDHVAIVKIKDGRVVGQWAQPDLWVLYQRLTSASTA